MPRQPKPVLPESERFRRYQGVYYHTAVAGFPCDRHALVIEDNGGPRVKIRWHTAEGPKIGFGRVVAYHGHPVEHWTARERLEARS